MFQRCENPNSTGYSNYGGRGIKVTRRWYEFKHFLADMGPKPSPDYELDRIDVNGNYCKTNCRWVNRSLQMLNRRKFSNGKCKHRGVHKKGDAYIARMDFEGTRYVIGHFNTDDEAGAAREKFERLFLKDREAAIATLPRDAARRNSSTGVRGVTPHQDGGYTVRVTVNKERKYLGYFQTLEDAIGERDRFLEARDSGA